MRERESKRAEHVEHMRACCRYTRRRPDRTHGGVLNCTDRGGFPRAKLQHTKTPTHHHTTRTHTTPHVHAPQHQTTTAPTLTPTHSTTCTTHHTTATHTTHMHTHTSHSHNHLNTHAHHTRTPHHTKNATHHTTTDIQP